MFRGGGEPQTSGRDHPQSLPHHPPPSGSASLGTVGRTFAVGSRPANAPSDRSALRRLTPDRSPSAALRQRIPPSVSATLGRECLPPFAPPPLRPGIVCLRFAAARGPSTPTAAHGRSGFHALAAMGGTPPRTLGTATEAGSLKKGPRAVASLGADPAPRSAGFPAPSLLSRLASMLATLPHSNRPNTGSSLHCQPSGLRRWVPPGFAARSEDSAGQSDRPQSTTSAPSALGRLSCL